MGRHAQTSSLSTTLIELGSLASRSVAAAENATHGRRRAEGRAKTSLSPMIYRAGGTAAVQEGRYIMRAVRMGEKPG